MNATGPTYHREYLQRLPLPLAQLYLRANNAKDARGRHDHSFYLLEALVKLAACPPVACYLEEVERGRARVPALDHLLAQLALPSLGQWVAMVRELARHFGTRPDAASHPLGHLWEQINARHRSPGLVSLYRRIRNGPDGTAGGDQSCTLLQLFESLVQYRNGVFGHGAARFDGFYESQMGPLLFPAADELLAEGVLDLLGPRGARLIYLQQIRAINDHEDEASVRELVGLQGERAAPLLLGRDESRGLAPNGVALLWPGRKLPLRLDPLLAYRESETADELLFLNRDRNGRQVEYLSYTTGKTERDKSMAAGMARLLSRVTGQAVSEGQLDELAQQSLGETPSVEGLFAPATAGRRTRGEYDLLAELGRGGMGVVYLARQLSLGRIVALKMLPADLAGDEVSLARFRREMRALARCEHPNIVKVLASGTMPDGQLYYTMEYVPGCDLEQVWREVAIDGTEHSAETSKLGNTTFARAVLEASRKKRDKSGPPGTAGDGPGDRVPDVPPLPLPLPPLPDLPAAHEDPGGYVRRVVTLVRDAALALHAVHEQRIVHRDVKPANLMLTPDAGRIVLMDFGLAKGQTLELTASRTGGLLGTLRYAAPEQLAAANLKVGPEADVRGLGAVLWELLTRRRLFAEAEDERQLTQKVLTGDVPRLRTVEGSFDADLEEIVARSTARDAEQRIGSARLLAEYLGLWLEGKPLPIRPPGVGELLRRWVRAHKAQVAAAAAVSGVIVAVVATAFWIVNGAKNQAVAAKNDAIAAEDKERRSSLRSAALATRNAELAAEAGRAADRLRLTLSATDQEIGHLLNAAGKETEAIAHAARALGREANPSNQAAIADAFAWLVKRRIPDVILGHDDAVVSASFSPDGARVVTASVDKTARVWDAATGKPLGEPMRHEEFVRRAAFSPDGTRVVTAGADNAARLWDAASGKAVGEPMRHDGSIDAVAFSPDGGRVVTASSDKTTRVWDAATGALVGKPLRHEGGVNSAEFSPDGARVVTGHPDTTARVWDAVSGKPVGEPMRHEAFVTSAAFSPDGARVVTVSGYTTARVWDAATGARVGEAMRHEERVSSVSFGPDGARVLTVDGYRTVRVWDAVTGKPAGEPMRHEGKLGSAAFSPDGTRVVTASGDKAARVWDAATGRSVGEPMWHEHVVLSAAFSPDGTRVVTASGDKTARVWGAASSKPVTEPMRHDRSVESATFSPDGTRVATASEDMSARVWDASTGRPVGEPMRHEGSVDSAAFSPDGTRVVTASRDKTARVWDAATGRPVGEPMRHEGSVDSAAFSPDGTRVVTGSMSDNTARVWGAASGRPVGKPMRHESSVRSAAFSPDGTRVVTASWDMTARVWDASTGQPLGEPMRHDGWVDSAVFSPDGTRVVTASGKDRSARVWDASTGKPVGEPIRHEDGVRSAAFNADGTRLVTAGSWGDSAWVWDALTGKQVGEPMRHDESVTSAEFSPDGTRVLTTSYYTTEVWDASTGKPLGEPMRHRERFGSAAFSPDGTRVVTSRHRTALVWDVSLPAPTRQAGLWLSELGQLASNQRFGPTGVLEPLGADLPLRRERLARELADPQAPPALARTIGWFLADPRDRSISPSSTMKAREWVRRRTDEFTTDSVCAAWELDPTDATCVARRGRLFALQEDADRYVADLYSGLALKLAPASAEIGWRRSAVLAILGRKDEAARQADRSGDPPADSVWAWQAKWEACLFLGRDDEAKAARTNVDRLARALEPFVLDSLAARCKEAEDAAAAIRNPSTTTAPATVPSG